VSEVELRLATAEDSERIAELHARSWREHYRGIYSDVFLDDEALADRLEVWHQRLERTDPGTFTVVAEVDGALVGFAYVVRVGDDPTLQNLHVRSDAQRRGVGSQLVAEVLRTVGHLHVSVREDNAAGRAFYEACGGTPAGRTLGGPFADGSRAPALCFAWPGDH
jgi:ribosomal protein S18 acetylase RimI-like enzyme